MEGIYKDKLRYDNKGDHIYWSVNGYKFGKIDYNLTAEQRLKFDYEIPVDLPYSDYKTEVRNALIKLYEKHKKTLAICVSGADSEIIVREAVSIGIPCKVYFLNFWGVNADIRKLAQKLARSLNLPFVVISLTEKECFEKVILESYELMQIMRASYLCMPYLFKHIPEDEFIIVGEGDLAKGHVHFGRIAKKLPNRGLPIMATEILYRIWAQENCRWGEYYFHSSTPELIISGYNDPDLSKEHPYISTSKMYKKFWPELTFTDKTDNWEFMQDKHKLLKETLIKISGRKEQIVWANVPHKSLWR